MIRVEKLKVFISSKMGDKYNSIRNELTNQLESTHLFDVYTYELTTASTHPNVEQYLFELSKSDVVIFIIDNHDENKQESPGVRKEFDKAKELQKPSLFYFCNKDDTTETAYQQEIMTTPFAGKFVNISNLEEVLNIAIEDLVKDVFDAYRKYSQGYYISSEGIKPLIERYANTESAIQVGDTSTNYVANYFRNFIFGSNKETEVTEKSFDYYAYRFLLILFNNGNIEEYNFNLLLEKTEDVISNDYITTIIKDRWQANQKYLLDEKQEAINILKNIYEENKKNSEMPKWLLTDILIDLRNWMNKNNQELSIFDPNNYAQKEIEKSKGVYHPIIDRNKSSLLDWIESDRQKKDIQSIYAVSYYGDFSMQLSQISHIYYQAILYGSYTHLVSVFHIMQKFTYHLGIQTGDYKIQLSCLKLSTISLNSKELRRTSSLFHDLMVRLNESQAKEILTFSSIFFKSSTGFQNQLKAMSVFGYYLSDSDFKKYWLNIEKYIDNWFEKENPNIHLEDTIFSTIHSVGERLNDTQIFEFGLHILNSSKNRFKSSAVRMLGRDVDYQLIDNELITELGTVLISELKEKNIDFIGLGRTNILFIKIMKNYCIKEVEEFIQKEYPDFYKDEYFLELLSFENQEEINNAMGNLYSDLTLKIEEESAREIVMNSSKSTALTIANLISKDSNNLIKKSLIKKILSLTLDGLNEKLSYQDKKDLYFLILTILTDKWSEVGDSDQEIIKILQSINHEQMLSSEEHIALETYHNLLLEILGYNLESQPITDLLFIKDSDVTVDILYFLFFYDSYKDNLSLKASITLYNFILKCTSSEVLEIRQEAVKILIQYAKDKNFAANAKRNIEVMMIDDHMNVKTAIASQIQYIEEMDTAFAEKIIDMVEKNNNFLLRKILTHYRKQPLT